MVFGLSTFNKFNSAPSQRQDIVQRLTELEISVDIWGGCGPGGRRPDSEWNRIGKATFFAQYRYYLSFENSFCEDYATEKLFRGLNASYLGGAIPVAYSAANYSLLVPSGSVIDVTSFSSTTALADYLKLLKLPTSIEQVKSYYQWHYDYEVSEHDSWPGVGLKNLCRKLFDDSDSNTVESLEYSFGKCHQLPNVVLRVNDSKTDG